MKNILLTATLSITIVTLFLAPVGTNLAFAGNFSFFEDDDDCLQDGDLCNGIEKCNLLFNECVSIDPVICVNPDHVCIPNTGLCAPEVDEQVAGQLLPLDSTALLLAGIQSMTVWMVPTVLGLAGAAVYLVKFRANRD